MIKFLDASTRAGTVKTLPSVKFTVNSLIKLSSMVAGFLKESLSRGKEKTVKNGLRTQPGSEETFGINSPQTPCTLKQGDIHGRF